MKRSVYLMAMFSLLATVARAQDILGVWFNDVQDAKIEIYKGNNGKYYGKIIWLKEPLRDGKPKVDKYNSKSSLQVRPIMGLVILSDLEQKGEAFENGTIYDPKSGKTYSCTVNKNGKDKLNIRGYVGVSMFGKTTTWSRTR